MPGLVSDTTGRWLRENVGRSSREGGTFNHNYTDKVPYEDFHVRLLPTDDPDRDTHALIYFPNGKGMAVSNNGDVTVYSALPYDASVFEMDIDNPGGGDPTNVDCELEEVQNLGETGTWYKIKLADNEALYAIATSRTRNVMNWGEVKDAWALVHYPLGRSSTMPVGTSKEYNPTFAQVIARRVRPTEADAPQITQYYEGKILINAPCLPFDKDQTELPIDLNPTTLEPTGYAWKPQGYPEGEFGDLPELQTATPAKFTLGTGIFYDDSSYTFNGGGRTVELSFDGRINLIDQINADYVIETVAEGVYP